MAEEVEEVVEANALSGAETVSEIPENTQIPETAETENPEIEVHEPEAEAPVEKVHGNKGKIPWQTHRINEETNKRRLLEEELAQTRRERAEALALLERQGGEKPAAKQGSPSDADIEARVEALASRKLFDADCGVVAQAWENEAKGDFKPRLDSLKEIGVLNEQNSDFLLDIFAVDKTNAHKILDSLAQNPDLAFDMTKMDSRRRIAALTRMTMTEKPAAAPAAPKPAAVSKVPAPKPVVHASSGVDEIDEEKMTDEEWSRWRKKEQAKKFG